MGDDNDICIEVAYASPASQHLIEVRVAAGTSVEQAIRLSGMLECFPELDLDVNTVGIFSKHCSLGDTICGGDRIEIYRPLIADAKAIRRARAARR